MSTLATARPDDIDILEQRVNALYEAKAYPAALVQAEKLEVAVKDRYGTKHPAYAASLNKLANVQEALGKSDEAEGLYNRALAIFEQALGKNHHAVAKVNFNLAGIFSNRGEYEKAAILYERSLVVFEHDQDNHGEVVGALHSLANVRRLQGRPTEAEALVRRELSIVERVWGAITR